MELQNYEFWICDQISKAWFMYLIVSRRGEIIRIEGYTLQKSLYKNEFVTEFVNKEAPQNYTLFICNNRTIYDWHEWTNMKTEIIKNLNICFSN